MNLEVGLTKCFFCGKSKDIIMNTRLTKKAADEIKKINGKVIDTEPCNECKELMKQGVMLLSCKDGDMHYRTGKIAVIKDEAIKRMLENEKDLLKQVLEKRYCIIEDTAWNMLGLPNGGKDE